MKQGSRSSRSRDEHEVPGGYRRVLRRFFLRLTARGTKPSHHDSSPPDSVSDDQLSGDPSRDASRIEELFGHSDDLVVRPIGEGDAPNRWTILFMDGLVSRQHVAEHIVAPLLHGDPVIVAEVDTLRTLTDVTHALTLGQCVVLQRGHREARSFGVQEWNHRAIEDSFIEPSLVGPQEAFVEDLKTNVILLRRRLRTHLLHLENMTLGRRSRTRVAILHLDGISRIDLVEEVRQRLQRIDIDRILDTNDIAELISDNPWSPFPSVSVTDRADRVAAELLEGRVAILVDGSPIALIAPTTLFVLLQAADDYYLRYFQGSFARLIRWGAGLTGLLAPSIYVSVLSYHHELIPTRLLFTIATGREGIPFPPVLEALLMELSFEILREAGVRLPMKIGPALSIVGVLVIGDAAVRAGLVSPLMIVVVGMTAISSFAIPSTELSNTVRMLRFPTVILAGLMGLFGVFLAFMLIVALLISSRSFGVPYLSPVNPISVRGLRDALWRSPVWDQRFRPEQMAPPDEIVRQPADQMPRPFRGKEGKPR